MSWRRFFRDYDVPARIQDLVDRGLLEDASRSDDPAPSFIAKLYNRGCLRIWVEHPELKFRRAGPYRYRVEIAKNLDETGRLLIEDNVLQEVWPTFYATLRSLGAKSRWRLMGAMDLVAPYRQVSGEWFGYAGGENRWEPLEGFPEEP